MKKLTFESENLAVDYLTFNRDFYDPKVLQEIADYFWTTFGWSVILVDKKAGRQEPIGPIQGKGKSKVKCVINGSKYWNGLSVQIESTYAKHFYQTMTATPDMFLNCPLFDFSEYSLGRIDLAFDRPLNTEDGNLCLFLEEAEKYVQEKSGNLTAKLSQSKQKLSIGKRASPFSFRVYLKANLKSLRFELELKKVVAKRYQHELFAQQFESFEQHLVVAFFEKATKSFDLTNPYLDWLKLNFRRIRKMSRQSEFRFSFEISYLANEPFQTYQEIEVFYRFLQFLNFLKNRDSKKEFSGGKFYRMIEFPLNEFLDFIEKPRNSYQQKEASQLFKKFLWLPPIIEQFDDIAFKGYVLLPQINIIRKRYLSVNVQILEDLYFHPYPFHFPSDLLRYNDKNDLRVKISFLKSFAIRKIEKEFVINALLVSVNQSNYQKTKLKMTILSIFELVQKNKLIEPGFRICKMNNKIITVNKLTLPLIGQSKSIRYQEKY